MRPVVWLENFETEWGIKLKVGNVKYKKTATATKNDANPKSLVTMLGSEQRRM